MARPIERTITTSQILRGVSEGQVSQREAMEALRVDSYGQVLNALADHGLPFPIPPEKEVREELAQAMPLLMRMEAAVRGSDNSNDR